MSQEEKLKEMRKAKIGVITALRSFAAELNEADLSDQEIKEQLRNAKEFSEFLLDLAALTKKYNDSDNKFIISMTDFMTDMQEGILIGPNVVLEMDIVSKKFIISKMASKFLGEIVGLIKGKEN